MDRLKFRRFVFYGYHGIYPEENRLGQKFYVDLDVGLDLSRSAQSDDIADTVNYAEVHGLLKEIVEGPPVKLIETVAHNIATAVLGRYTDIVELTVAVTKPHPPVDFVFDGATVEIRRRRDASGRIVPAES